ncbi:uncharacterized protein [Hyperolius riggenbachi]|uniref:uncharacterized protein n=1 Tax=Hyperolius riggenbachi TaxID=752182 RepID=UPI0035A3876A
MAQRTCKAENETLPVRTRGKNLSLQIKVEGRLRLMQDRAIKARPRKNTAFCVENCFECKAMEDNPLESVDDWRGLNQIFVAVLNLKVSALPNFTSMLPLAHLFKSIVTKCKEYGRATNLTRAGQQPSPRDRARKVLFRCTTIIPRIMLKELQRSTAEMAVSVHRTHFDFKGTSSQVEEFIRGSKLLHRHGRLCTSAHTQRGVRPPRGFQEAAKELWTLGKPLKNPEASSY